MTLEQVAERFDAADLMPQEKALRSLKRCRPDRPPVYRHGDVYHLDPFDAELSLWAFRLGLRPARGAPPPDDETPQEARERQRRNEERRAKEAADLASMRRAVIRAFPSADPAALVVLDVDDGHVARFAGDNLGEAVEHLAQFDVLAAVNARPTFISLGIDVASRRIHELRPSQKTIRASARGTVLNITMEHLLRSSCGIKRRWGREDPLRKLLDAGKTDRLLDRLEAEVMDLAALYHFGRLQHVLRIRWRTLDEIIRVHWVQFDEWGIWDWARLASKAGQPLEVVAGSAPDPDDPWGSAEWCTLYSPEGYVPVLVTSNRDLIQIRDVQRLRMARPGDWHAPLPPEAAGPSTSVGSGWKASRADERILRVRITLALEGEPVWRVIELPAGSSFWDLHVAIQDVMGWLDYHLHSFGVRDPDDGSRVEIGIPLDDMPIDEEPPPLPSWRVPVLRFLNSEQPECTYIYDFGDWWVHELRLEALEPADPTLDYPRCIDGARACPPEDVGGTFGYEEFLEVLADPNHEDHEHYKTWSGGQFDPEAFDAAAVTFRDPGEHWATAFCVRT